MALEIIIATGSEVPLYEQIYQQIRRAVASGALVEGDQLPSVRSLAEQLVLNPNTVVRAYNLLASDGIVASHQGKGIFIAKARQILSDDERVRRARKFAEGFADEAQFLRFTLSEAHEYLDEAWRRSAKGKKLN